MKDFDRNTRAWRDPAEVISHWQTAGDVDPDLLRYRVSGEWWQALQEARVTLFVTRETEHVVLAMHHREDRPEISHVRLPHPSGLAVDRSRSEVHIACTRNPNQVVSFRPVVTDGHPLVPTVARFYPGDLYLHDLAIVGGVLHGNAVGQNAVVKFSADAGSERVWWPASIDSDRGPRFERNYLQLNSIAAGDSIEESFFSASSSEPGHRRPGHLDYPVDRRGVIFSGTTREPVVRGLTRPHSARTHDGRIWVDDSGYGTFGPCLDGRLEIAASLPGWTRGLTFVGRTAFVGTSHVISRFRRYAPGVDHLRTRCGIHAIDVETGRTRGSITWPSGNQVFAIDWIDAKVTSGFPFKRTSRGVLDTRQLFFGYQLERA